MEDMNINRINGGVFLKRIKILLIVIFVLGFLFPTNSYGDSELIPILMYHNIIGTDEEGDGLNVSSQIFEEQIKYLKYHGYNTIDFGELYSYFKGESSLPSNPIIITFDDGYESNHKYAYPVLKKYGYKATVFMITDYIGKDWYMTEEMLKKIQGDGVFDVQSHSTSHSYDLAQSDKEDMIYEVKKSKEVLEELLDKSVNIFCYPYGKNSESLRSILKDEGYTVAVTTEHGVASQDNDYFKLKRLRVSGSDRGKGLINRIEKNTKNSTNPIYEDVDVDDPNFLELINEVTSVAKIEEGVADYLSNTIKVKASDNEEKVKVSAIEAIAKDVFDLNRDRCRLNRGSHRLLQSK